MRFLRFIVTLILVPVNIIMTAGLVKNFTLYKEITQSEVIFTAGFISYLLVHFILYRPVFMHVMSHELTHAFWAMLFGGKVKALNISKQGGSVTMEKSNFFVILAPYFFPFYTAITLVICFIADPRYKDFIVFLVGLTYSFHIALTLYSLKQKQTDLKEAGVIFSYMFIYLANLLVFTGILAVISKQFDIVNFFKESYGFAEGFFIK